MKKKLDNSDFNKTIAPWIALTYKMLDQHLAELFLKQNVNITKQQWIILKILTENKEGIIQNELAFFTNRNKASLARLISVMEKNNLVERKNSVIDARINLVFITKYGFQVFSKMKPLVINCVKSLQEGLSKEEILNFKATLTKIQHNIKNQSF
ncbi:MarR family winged helix-turn-helix transcriptional regulator [Lutibacter sp.]|uniref:MarR family winged helix-turn-helix transcriptional regulator n=1 Tax=Lutibacter sp. TaxID=1925666 RepID=UPI0035620D3B